MYYHLLHLEPSVPSVVRSVEPKVVMVYCTYNDFSADSLYRSTRQDYSNFEVVILDDSTDAEYQAKVDSYASEHDVLVVRRDDRVGFKAGNLNNYLMKSEYDYFVILDSDEITPPNFITRCIDYFDYYTNVGIVQANHIATRDRNGFMGLFSAGVDSHWIAYQSVKHRFGFLSLLGHGAMVSRACYMDAGGFPMVVAEDLCMSIAARDHGYLTAFASDVTCEEEYPVNYLAFKKRHSKWTQGNMEFIKRFTGTIMRSRMKWYEKLDIVLFTYSLPLTSVFSLFVLIHVVALPVLGYTLQYPLVLLIPTVVFLFAPMLNDVLFYWGKIPAKKLLRYLGYTMLLYGSMFYTSLRSSLKSAFGGSTFLVTPKDDQEVSLSEALRANAGEMLFGVGLGLVATALTGSVLPVVLLVVPALSSVYLTVMHHSTDDKQLDRPQPEWYTCGGRG
jgi:cellulose synthase/poly-beta-1,6-N-acetylglucosamine synthase-like glycosyltransferase